MWLALWRRPSASYAAGRRVRNRARQLLAQCTTPSPMLMLCSAQLRGFVVPSEAWHAWHSLRSVARIQQRPRARSPPLSPLIILPGSVRRSKKSNLGVPFSGWNKRASRCGQAQLSFANRAVFELAYTRWSTSGEEEKGTMTRSAG